MQISSFGEKLAWLLCAMLTSLCAVNRNSAVQVDYFAPQSLCRLKVETIIVDEKPLPE